MRSSWAKDLGLPSSWVTIDDTSSDRSTLQQREDHALRAIRTLGILSTYYQPLILAFDQLEGFRDQAALTQAWGDTVREIFTMTPNFLVLTCIFPSLWETWFTPQLQQSVRERIAQQTVHLDTFGPQYGLRLLETLLEPSFKKHRLPTAIFPFTEQNVTELCQQATSPRSFIQAARAAFQSWLDGATNVASASPHKQVVSQDAIDALLKTTLTEATAKQRLLFESEMVVEQDVFGRIRNLIETLLRDLDENFDLGKAKCGQLVMPPNMVVGNPGTNASVCLAIMNSEGNSFAARMRNLNKCLTEAGQFDHLIMLRYRHSKKLGARSEEHLAVAIQSGAAHLVLAGSEEMACLNAAYEALVAVEESDLCIGHYVVDKRQLVAYLRTTQFLGQSEVLRQMARHNPALAAAIGLPIATLPLCKNQVAQRRAEPCPECGRELVVRRGPVGSFLGCSGYPACRFSKDSRGCGEAA